jgi:hypothetical protein
VLHTLERALPPRACGWLPDRDEVALELGSHASHGMICQRLKPDRPAGGARQRETAVGHRDGFPATVTSLELMPSLGTHISAS